MVFFTTKSLSQDKNNPWQISLGTSAVNFYGTAQEGLCTGCNDLFQDYFEVDKYWNIQTFFSTASIARYTDNGFSIGIRASLNKFDQIGNDKFYSKICSYCAEDNLARFNKITGNSD